MRITLLLIGMFLLVFLAGCYGKGCAEDVRQCPDGSWVGREGPRCEFAACPEGDEKTPPTRDDVIPPSDAECQVNRDCVPASCCHADSCVPASQGPTCKGIFCTQECVPSTIDCGGGCKCSSGKCEAFYANLS